MKGLFIVIVSGALFGCATNQHDARIAEARFKAYTTMQKPLVSVECPESGCNFKQLVVNNPEPVVLPKETNGYDAWNKTMDVIGGGIPYGVIGWVAREGFKAAGDTTITQGSHNQDAQSTDGSYNQSTQTQDSHDQQHTTTTANDSYNQQTDGSYNQDDNSQVDNSTTTTSSTDNTHEPTVVTQPAPIIITPSGE